MGQQMKPLEREIAGAPLVEAVGVERDGPHPVDRHVGLRIRMRRKEIGVSQERLAESLGITFQQVQKYERGANRVSASKLWEIAAALKTGVGYFYEGLGDRDAPTRGDPTQAFMVSGEGLELMASFPRISEPTVRRKILELVRAVADEG
jgi:transcriptional regulator with XRE-family HTH domain